MPWTLKRLEHLYILCALQIGLDVIRECCVRLNVPLFDGEAVDLKSN